MKLLIGGSPCTHWSIAQTKNRETEASGIGWELFLNYRIARDKYRPDFFLYENNKSMSPAIRAQITAELGVEPVLINSAKVSAQNRQRLYWVGRRNPDGTYSQVDVEQPVDRGILLRDILETGVAWREKSYCVTATEYKGSNAEHTLAKHTRTMAAEPVCVPVAGRVVGRRINGQGHRDDYNEAIPYFQYFEVNEDPQKTNCLTTVRKDNMIAVPVRVGAMPNKDGDLGTSQSRRIYSVDGKSVSLQARPNGGGADGAATGLYAVPINQTADGKAQTIKAQYGKNSIANFCCYTSTYGATGVAVRVNIGGTPPGLYIERPDGKQIPVYEVHNGKITIKGKEYPIKLADGFYIIRKLTVAECKSLQTVPDTYTFPVSDAQAYKMLGNGWTVDVIAHIMSHFDRLTEEPVEVLSMYDGMSCGRIALDKLGVDITAYYATEIDKYAIQATQHNYPDTVQLGDAFRVREDDWELPQKEAK